MSEQLERIRVNLSDAGCDQAVIERAPRLYETGRSEELVKLLRRCRCGLMAELHENQRRVDRIDYLIRRTKNAFASK
jgi:hypothetical protein